MPSVDTGIIDFALHPGFGLLKPHLDGTGPFTGNVTRTQWSSTLGPIYSLQPVSNTFGVIVLVEGAFPANYGRDLGWVDVATNSDEDYYHNRLTQVVIQHQLLSGAWVTTQLVDVHAIQTLIMWQVALPGRIGLYTAPGLSFDLYYLLIN